MQISVGSFIFLVTVLSFGHSMDEEMMQKPECQMWAKLENKTLPLQDQGHANCTTNSDCTGFSCKGIYQDRGIDFGLEVMPCSDPPGVKIFGYAPQFNAKNFSHIFVHGNDYEIPGAILNSSILPASAVHPSSETEEIKGRLEVHLKMNEDHEDHNVMTMGLFIKACVHKTCIFKRKVFDETPIPVPKCTNQIADLKPAADSFCNINELFGCGDNQICVQLHPDDNMGRCQCLQGFDKQDDGTCLSLKEEDEMIAKEKAENNHKNTATQPVSSAKESGFVKDNSNPQPHVGEGNSGGAIAAGVVSVLIVILVITGFTYMVSRTRVLPRLRARITNKPYEDIIINDRGQQAAAQQQQQQPSTLA